VFPLDIDEPDDDADEKKQDSKASKVCVMWNDLPEMSNGKKYQVHIHVDYNKLDSKGKPKVRFEKNPVLVKKEEEVANLEKELSRLENEQQKAKKKARDVLCDQIDKGSIVLEELRAEVEEMEEKVPAIAKTYVPNGHILEPPYYIKKLGGCPLLVDDAIEAALDFRTKMIEFKDSKDARKHLMSAHRKLRPKPFRKGDDLLEKGKEYVEWYEDKGENKLTGLSLFMKKDEMVYSHVKRNDNITYPFNVNLLTCSTHPGLDKDRRGIRAVLSKYRDWDKYLEKQKKEENTPGKLSLK